MADQKNGGIAWCTKTWNPIRGCSEVSPGCKNCYARTMGARFAGPGMPYEGLIELRRKPGSKRYAEWTGKVRFVRERLADPLRWKKPERIFVNSMSDLFHKALPFERIADVFDVMRQASQHTFLVLTKRPERAKAFFDWVGNPNMVVWHRWPLPNVQIGVSVEDQKTAEQRIPWLFEVPAAVRWVSLEPQLGDVDFTALDVLRQGPVEKMHPHDPIVRVNALTGHVRGPDEMLEAKLDWIVVGGESGPGARPFDIAWARSTVEQCRAANVPVFVKQLGSNRIEDGLSDRGHTPGLDHVTHRAGADPNEWPEDLRVQEFPET